MEVHAELATRSKMFCGCPVGFGGEPNSRVCPVCTAQPGSLPVPNRAAVEMVIRTALALNCTVPEHSIFHRKNYFYPDLPKGYQISQYGETNPLGHGGWLDIPAADGSKRVHIRRVHLEEDTGKLMHLPAGESGIDYNRAGVPLMEIVTEFPPDIHSSEQCREYLTQLRLLLLYLGVCDGKMEEGSFRGEPNISVSTVEGALGVKTELKNLSSFRAVTLGVDSEVRRQSEALARGEKIVQQTRGWNEEREDTFVMRTKEEENDYRYFPDPDLPPMRISGEWVERLRASLPELPMARRGRYLALGLSEKEAMQIIAEPETAYFFDGCLAAGAPAKVACNWIVGEMARLLKEAGHGIGVSKALPGHIAELHTLVEAGALSATMAKDVFGESFRTGRSPKEISSSGVGQISDREALVAECRKILEANGAEVQKYKAGNANLLGFFVGQVMKATQGRANPQMLRDILQEELNR